MATVSWRKRSGIGAFYAVLILLAHVPMLADEVSTESGAFSRPGVAARSDASTATTGRSPLAARIIAGARTPIAPEPTVETTSPSASKGDVKPGPTTLPERSSANESDDSDTGSRSPDSRTPSDRPKQRLASVVPSLESVGDDGESPPRTAPAEIPRRRVSPQPAQVSNAASRTPDRSGETTGQPTKGMRGASASSAVKPPVGKPTKDRWGVFRWFNPEWFRPAEPLPMIPPPWSFEKAESSTPRTVDAIDGSAETAAVTKSPRTQVLLPRIALDVRESAIEVAEGDPISFRIVVGNGGKQPAHDVDTTIYFAEGIEPETVVGMEGTIFAGEVRFATIEEIPPGEKREFFVRGRAGAPGIVVYRAELIARETPGTIAREGAVTVLGKVFGPQDETSTSGGD